MEDRRMSSQSVKDQILKAIQDLPDDMNQLWNGFTFYTRSSKASSRQTVDRLFPKKRRSDVWNSG